MRDRVLVVRCLGAPLVLRRIHCCFLAIWTLPSGIFALIVPLLVAPVFKMLVSAGAAINGEVLTFSNRAVLPIVGYVILLCSAWLSGLSANTNDLEFTRLMNFGQVRYYILPVLALHALFAVMVSFASLLSLFFGGATDNSGFSFLSVSAIVFEIVLFALLGCGLGLVLRNGILAVSALFLYSILLSPAIIRLFPSVESRGLGARLSEITSSTPWGAGLALDFVFYGTVCILFFLYYALRVLRIEHAKF